MASTSSSTSSSEKVRRPHGDNYCGRLPDRPQLRLCSQSKHFPISTVRYGSPGCARDFPRIGRGSEAGMDRSYPGDRTPSPPATPASPSHRRPWRSTLTSLHPHRRGEPSASPDIDLEPRRQRLVAGRRYDSPRHDHRPHPQAGLVVLLDVRIEGVPSAQHATPEELDAAAE